MSSGGLNLPASLGGYKIVGRISEGGMGAVVLGRREGARGFSKQVAIKVLLPQYLDQDEVKELFFSEARLAARLSHPAVCQVFDFGEEAGLYYLVMEYLEGESLARVLSQQMRRGERLPLELGARILAEAARGLHHAHTLGDESGQPLQVVHRDVSPQNLLLTRDGHTKVLDFGIAKSRDRATATQQGILRGKPAYMSPEQTRSEPLDARSDIFSLGTVFFELVPHTNPFVRDNVYATIQAIGSERAPDPRSRAPELPEAAARIINCALAPTPAERVADADVLARALDQLIAQLGRPAGPAELAAQLKLLYPTPRELAQSRPGTRGRSESQQTLPAQDPEENLVTAMDDGDLRQAPQASLTDTSVAVSRFRRGQRLTLAGLGLVVLAGGTWQLLRDGSGTTDDHIHGPGQTAGAQHDASGAAAARPDAGHQDAAHAQVDRTDANPAADRRRRSQRKPHRRRPVPAPRDPLPLPTPTPASPVDTPAAPRGSGSLSVPGADPYFLLFVDGQLVGPTPVLRRKLPSGTHQIEIKSADNVRVVLRREVQILEGVDSRVSEHLKR